MALPKKDIPNFTINDTCLCVHMCAYEEPLVTLCLSRCECVEGWGCVISFYTNNQPRNISSSLFAHVHSTVCVCMC